MKQFSTFRRWVRILPLAFVALGLALLLVGQRPVEYADFDVPLFIAPLGSSDRAVEVRSARGGWAQTVPAGQEVPIHVTIDGAVPGSADQTTSVLSLDGLYAGSSPQVEARLEIRGVRVQPPGSIVQNLAPAEPVSLYWRVNAPRAGSFEGTLWIYVNHADPSDRQNRQLVFARPVTVSAVDVFGLSSHLVRSAGWVSIALGLLGAFPLWRTLFLQYWARVRRERSPI